MKESFLNCSTFQSRTAIVLASVFLLVASSFSFADEPSGIGTPEDWKEKLFASDARITLKEPQLDAVVSLAPEAVLKYKAPEERGWDAAYSPASAKEGKNECSLPTPVRFSWEWSDDVDGQFTLQLSTERIFLDCIEIECGRETACEATNLDIGTTYFWRVKIKTPNADPNDQTLTTTFSPTSCFSTAPDPPRWFNVLGVSNFRDFGGWKAANGKRVKKGMIYRGTEMDGHFGLSEDGKRFMLDELGIRSDFDLRGPGEWGNVPDYSSPLGENVRWINFRIGAYDSIFTDEQKVLYRDIFKTLTDESVYPTYVHCWGGADRTGTLIMMIKAILGVSDNDLCADYEMTTFSTIGERYIHADYFEKLTKGLENFGGKDAPLSVKFENYLKSIGVTEEELDKIRELLLEDAEE